MTDILLGAAIGTSGTVVGAVVAGLIYYRIAKLQINAGREELNRKLAQQEYELNRKLAYQWEETRRDRLIEARKAHLDPLRKTISGLAESSNKSVAMLVRVQQAQKKKDPSELKQELELMEEVFHQSARFSSEVEILRGQVGDSKLDNLIQVVINAQSEAGVRIMPLLRLFNNPQNVGVNSLEAAFGEYQLVLQELRSKLLAVNKRVEELLIGEPSA